MINRLQHQVRIADIVIINKIDLSSKGQIEDIESTVRSLNPFTQILRSSYREVSDQELIIDDLMKTIAEKT